MFMFFDRTMFIVLPALAFAIWAQFKVRSTYEKFARVRAGNGLTGQQMAAAIMARNGVTDVTIEPVAGVLNDHYDPGARKVRLSEPIYAGDSISSIAVAAHEVGHVLQHHQGYALLGMRSAMAPVVGLGSTLAFPLFFVGMLVGTRAFGGVLMDLGILFFTGAVLFHLVTLPVEFDASRRALAQLTSSGAVMPEEVAGAKQVLDAAALTYVAAAATAALELIRLVLLRNSRN